MAPHIVKIISIYLITPDVLKIVTEKPPLFNFTPGQATEICVNIDGCRDEKRPFTFTGIPADEYLEFGIKSYPALMGLTNKMLHLKGICFNMRASFA